MPKNMNCNRSKIRDDESQEVVTLSSSLMIPKRWAGLFSSHSQLRAWIGNETRFTSVMILDECIGLLSAVEI